MKNEHHYAPFSEVRRMSIGNFFRKVGSTFGKQIKKFQINSKRKEEIRIIKEKYLSQLSHRELVQIYKAYFDK